MTIASEFPLPELLESDAAPDVTVRRGRVPDALPAAVREGVLFQAQPGSYLLRIPDTARYLVEQGCRVTIEIAPGADEGRVRLFFLGSVLTALMHQRGRLVLHAAALAGANGAVVLAGHSGHGKSTLLAALAARGAHVLADDAAVIDASDDARGGEIVVQPGFPRTSLWRDALALLGLDGGDWPRIREDLEKFGVPMHEVFAAAPTPLRHICVLSLHNGDTVGRRQLRDADVFETLRAHTRNLRVLEGVGMQGAHFRQAARVAAQVPMTLLQRPHNRNSVAELVAIVQELLD